MPTAASKLKHACEVNRARAAGLVERVKAAVLAATSEVVVQRLCGLAELGRGEGVDRVAEVWVIQDVEEIASRLQRKTFGKTKLPEQRQVPLRHTETA